MTSPDMKRMLDEQISAGVAAIDDRQKLLARRNGNSNGNGNGHGSVILPPEQNTRYDDVYTAKMFLNEFGSDLLYLSEARRWMIWDRGRWKTDDTDFVFQLGLEFAEGLYQPENARTSEAIKHAQRTNSRKGLEAFLSIAGRTKTVSNSSLDTQPYLLNCRNGTLDLRTGELRDHDREDRITKMVNAEYDPEARSEAFEAFLAGIQPDPEVRAFLQRCIGYSLLGVVRERAFWILYGTGNNGKSIFVNLFDNLLGDYASGTTAASVMANKGSSIPNDIARLKGKRFVIIPETEENERFNAALVKQLSAGDTVTARFLFGEYFDFQFTGKLWIATNHKPMVTDHSKGFWERLKLVPFTVDIPADRLIKSDDLMATLMSQSSGILNWAVEGCREYLRLNSLATPPVIQREIDAYRLDQDIFAQFLEENTEQGEYYQAYKTPLYEKFRKFAMDAGYLRPPSHPKFTRRLKEMGYKDDRDHSGRYWLGFRAID